MLLIGVRDDVDTDKVLGELMTNPDAMEEIVQAGGITWYSILI